ncbi:leucine-rich repeat-containing G-protein coupled receptor 4 [Biomphalaria glabrata]
MGTRQGLTKLDSTRMLCKYLLICLFIITKSAEPPDCGMYRTAFPDCKCLAADDNNSKGVIDCSGLGLTSVLTPRSQINFIYELRLNNNSIMILKNNSFNGFSSGIRKLDLRDNKIATVENGCFDSLTNSLQYLFIDGNGTSDPPKVALSKLYSLTELTMRNYGEADLSDVSEKHLFTTFFNLQKLSLENWKLTSIASHAFSGPTNLISLTLNNNSLVILPINFLGDGNVGNLKQLTISNSNIQEISSYAFQKLNRLENLDLSHNHVNKLDQDCFDNLANSLYTLNLSGNILYSENLQGLRNLPNLTLLDLSANEGISSIPDLSLLGLAENNLRLYLGNNDIKILNTNSLASSGSHLHTLDLSSNAITSIDSNTFNSLTSLVSLNLSNQKLPTNIWTVIKPLIKLQVLNLSSAGLNNIPEFVFENMTNLRVLDLSSSSTSFHNSFTSVIQPAVFAGPRASFKEFYLSGSSVSRLSPCLFHGYTSFPITMSLFGGSYLTCDCDTYWLWMKIKNGDITFLPGHKPRCSSNWKLLSDLQQSDFCTELPSVSCTDYYEHPSPNATLAAGTTNISISWKIAATTSNIKLQSIKVEIDENGVFVKSLNLPTSSTTYVLTNLKNNTQYTVCVTAIYITDSSVSCKSVKTLGNIQSSAQSGDSNNTGIIVGCVIGGVVLVAIIVAIVYILFIRRKPQQKSDLPQQPRKFHKSEMPTMTGESRSFAKQKNINGSHSRDGNMQVLAISDGHTGPPRVGRAQVLTSQNSDGKPKSTSSISSSEQATYENDRGALPPVPNTKTQLNQQGYINMGYKRDSYDEIDPKREVSI